MELVHSVQPNMGGEGAPLLTCNTCGLGFASSEVQRLHMKTEWHRYNLKRRVANLPPISSEVFQEKVVHQQHMQQLSDEKTGRGSSGRSSGQRQITKKDKKREEKMLRKLAKQDGSHPKKATRGTSPARSESSMASSTFSLGEPVSAYAPSLTEDDESDDGYINDGKIPSSFGHALSDIEGTDEEDDEESQLRLKLKNAVEIPPNVCLVDGVKFESVEENVQYMTKKYGLYIPEQKYLNDLTGLITYLGEKVGLGNLCLYCNYQGKSVEAARAHMISKSHVKIRYESTEDKMEIGEFYDFRSSYKPKRIIDSSEVVADGEDWEDEGSVHSDEELEGDEEDVDADAAYIDASGFELVLAPGVRAGHRGLQRYYRQQFRTGAAQTEGQTTVLTVDNRTGGLLRARDPVEEKEQKLAWKEEKKIQNLYFRRDKFANNQPHYRDQLLQ